MLGQRNWRKCAILLAGWLTTGTAASGGAHADEPATADPSPIYLAFAPPRSSRAAAPLASNPPARTPAPTMPAPPNLGGDLTAEQMNLCKKIGRVLEMYYPRHQNTRDNDPWEVMHAIIAYGVDTQLFKGGPGGEKVNAVGWMCYSYPCKNDQILFLNRGQLDARRGVGVQGHHGQFLAILAQSHVKADYPIRCQGRDFTLSDLIEHEKQTCVAGEELTFKLISLAHYLDSDATWTSQDGKDWSIERLLQEELKQPIRGAACGGTHRLMGYSYSLKKRNQQDKPIDGTWTQAQKFLEDYHKYTFSLQNPDGSFSTQWFTRRESDPDIDRRLKTSGHILEWIGFSLSDNELRDPRMTRAVDYVATLLLKNDKRKWEIGPLGHSLHALSIYQNRMQKSAGESRPSAVVDAASPLVPAHVREARQASGATE